MVQRSQWLAAVIVLVLWGLITHGTSAGTGDEPHYQMITYSLAFDHDFDLTNGAREALGFESSDQIRFAIAR